MAMEIPKADIWEQTVFAVNYYANFSETALAVFRFQYQNNELYQRFCQALGKTPQQVQQITDIPFLPISFFKSGPVCTTKFAPQLIFESSGTTGAVVSRHYVKDAELYEKSFLKTFE